MHTRKPGNIDEYIDQFPQHIQSILKKIRSTIKGNVPSETTEKISYGMPTFFSKEKPCPFCGI